MTNFIGLSAVLTGFAAATIAPSIDPINVKEEYYAKFQAEMEITYSFRYSQTFKHVIHLQGVIKLKKRKIKRLEKPC